MGDHIDRLYRAARGMCVSRADAEDLVQETLSHVSKKSRFLHSDDDVGHLLRVLRNTFLNSTRFAHRRRAFPDLVAEPATELYRAVASLPDNFRDALIAVDLAGLSYDQAASALRVREATIVTRLHHGRQRVAEMLDARSGIA